jgi:hypothetical protein
VRQHKARKMTGLSIEASPIGYTHRHPIVLLIQVSVGAKVQGIRTVDRHLGIPDACHLDVAPSAAPGLLHPVIVCNAIVDSQHLLVIWHRCLQHHTVQSDCASVRKKPRASMHSGMCGTGQQGRTPSEGVAGAAARPFRKVWAVLGHYGAQCNHIVHDKGERPGLPLDPSERQSIAG